MNRDEVLRGIEEAFDDATMPRTEIELATPGIEFKCVIEHFFGKTREDVESQRFPGSLYMEDFVYMTDSAVLYYLPSVLRIMLANARDDELWIFVRGFLRGVESEYPHSSLTSFDVAQHSAIARWAEFLAGEWEIDEWMSGCSDEARELARTYRSLT